MAFRKNKTVRLASSHLITTCATLAAIFLFVALGSQVVPAAFNADEITDGNGLQVALLLNIAIIIFGWRRSKDLKEAIDAHEQAERAAHDAAYTDFITGLANRRQLMRSLEDMLSDRAVGTVVLLDLDDFKKVNDLHGHTAGDQLLASIAEILREVAPAASCWARTGGDEFAILLPFADTQRSEAVATAIVDRLTAPIRIDSGEVRVTASVGLAEFSHKLNPIDALRRSDVAMYAAKRGGRNCFAWFDSQLEHDLKSRAELEADIRSGIENGEFVPYFQPLISLDTGELVGFEVLARWKSPKHGLFEPKQFISLAEENGTIGPLSLSVMEQALVAARDWPPHLKLAVNVSPTQFRDPELAHRITQILTRTGFPAKRVELEITEGSLFEDAGMVATTVASLKNLGLTISLDDFGTGYASLAQLKTLPFDRIKIDQTFINALVDDQQSAAIVGTIAALGQSLSVPVTAEGVESEGVRGKLSGLGCSEAQGWLFGRAISARAVREFLDLAAKPGTADEDEASRRAAG